MAGYHWLTVCSVLLAVLVATDAQTLLPQGTYTTYTVAKGTTMYLSGTYSFNSLTIAAGGKLQCGAGAQQPNINLRAVTINVAGTFECGTAAAPYKGDVVITMTGNGDEGTKIIDVTGTIAMHGRPRSAWTSLSTTILPGDTSFTTSAAVDWVAGDLLVVSSTTHDPKMSEEVTIESVAPGEAGGTKITVTAAFKYPHWGELQQYSSPSKTWTLDERGQVALLERNIIFQGDGAPGGNGGIITIRKGGNGYCKNVKFINVGQKGPRLGTYPWHWHMLGDRKGNYFINNVVMRSSNRCVTVHGTDNVLVRNNVCYDNIGHAFFLEDGCEEGNTFSYNLGLGTKKPASLGAGSIDTDTTHLSTFWITNPNNHFLYNVAAGSEFAGYWFMLPVTPTRECSRHPIKKNVQPNKRPLGTFDHNIAHSNTVGVGIEGGIKNTDRAPTANAFWDPPSYPVFNNLTIFKNSHGQRHASAPDPRSGRCG